MALCIFLAPSEDLREIGSVYPITFYLGGLSWVAEWVVAVVVAVWAAAVWVAALAAEWAAACNAPGGLVVERPPSAVQ
jgi:hypothetical protein